MKALLVQFRVVLILLLLCLSSVSGAVQTDLDKSNQECADGKSSFNILTHQLETDDQEHDSCIYYLNNSDYPVSLHNAPATLLQKHGQKKSLQLIRAPPYSIS